MKRSLLIGCGTSRVKQIHDEGQPDWVGELTTMDVNPSCGADIVFDMERVANGGQLPFDDETFDEMGCYNAAEHWGRQGDFRGWFHEMGEWHRVLKPLGKFGIVVPVGGDAFADPGHTRFFSLNHFGFLNQAFYDRNEVLNTCFTDYRWLWKKNFDIHYASTDAAHIYVILQKA